MTDFYSSSFKNYPEMVKKWDSIYNVENIWNKISGPILELKNYLEMELQNVVFDGESETFIGDEFEVSFYAASPSGIDHQSILKRRFSTKEWAETKITFTRADLDKNIWGIIYYMVAFDSTIIIREAGGQEKPTILSMSLLGGLITPDYLDKKDKSRLFRVFPLGEGNSACASEKYERWEGEIREKVKNMPLYPIQLLFDADNLAQRLIDELHIRLRIDQIRFLEKIREQ